MMYAQVKDYLEQLVSLTDGEAESVESLCRTSMKEIESMLKADADRDDIRLVAAAAGKAYYRLMIKRNNAIESENVTDFKAGDVSITMQNCDIIKQLDEAENYYEKMLKNIIPLCADNCFAFRQVHIK